MASNYSANQTPKTHDGYTQIIANDRGHLLPSIPRSKASPWGTFMDTWKMPLQIPPARVDLTARSAAAANRLVNWVQKNPDLLNACNGLRPEIRGQPRPSGNDQCPKTQEKTATPQAIQESPHPSPVVNTPPSRGHLNTSPAPPSPPPPKVICSCSCSCSCSNPSKTSLNNPKTPESSNGHNGHNEPEGQEIQERNIENFNEAPQEVTGAISPSNSKEIME